MRSKVEVVNELIETLRPRFYGQEHFRASCRCLEEIGRLCGCDSQYAATDEGLRELVRMGAYPLVVTFLGVEVAIPSPDSSARCERVGDDK